jgi:ABC-type antimicrobial peptide transport system permease subunit
MTEMQQIVILPFRKVFQIALRGLRIRLVKTFLVTSCIALALTFLTYILSSTELGAQVGARGSAALQQRLARAGVLDQMLSEDQRFQTYWIIGIALLISFVGIVNAMLISVTERFREIGTMKCLGGLDSFIVKLYLVESLLQGIIGTVAGMALGLALAYGEGMGRFGADVWSLMPGLALVRILGISLLCGVALTVLGALYPAWRAARMEPVDAMRSAV